MRLALGTAPISLVAADLNGDGRLDLATANYRSDDVAVLLGAGTAPSRSPVRFAAGANPLSVTVGDFDGDGRLDLATANNNSDDVTLLLGRGDGTFADPRAARGGQLPRRPRRRPTSTATAASTWPSRRNWPRKSRSSRAWET